MFAQNPRTMSGSVKFPAPMLSVQDFGVGRAPRAGGVAAHPLVARKVGEWHDGGGGGGAIRP